MKILETICLLIEVFTSPQVALAELARIDELTT